MHRNAPVIEIDPALFHPESALWAACIAHKLADPSAHGRNPSLKTPFRMDRRLYVVTAIVGERYALAWELVSPASYEGKIHDGDNGAGYEGRVVRYDKVGLVMSNPVIFVPEGYRPEWLDSAAKEGSGGPKARGSEPKRRKQQQHSAYPHPEPRAPSPEPGAPHCFLVPLSLIDPSPFNPRGGDQMDPPETLTASIERHGVLEPLVARFVGSRYQLLAGERRFRAATAAGLHAVPVILKECADDAEAMLLTLTENLEREDLDPIEEATAFVRLREMGRSVAEIAKGISRSSSYVSNALRLLDLPAPTLSKVSSGDLAPAKARALLPWREEPERLAELTEAAVTGRTTQRDLENLARTEKRAVARKERIQERVAVEAAVASVEEFPDPFHVPTEEEQRALDREKYARQEEQQQQRDSWETEVHRLNHLAGEWISLDGFEETTSLAVLLYALLHRTRISARRIAFEQCGVDPVPDTIWDDPAEGPNITRALAKEERWRLRLLGVAAVLAEELERMKGECRTPYLTHWLESLVTEKGEAPCSDDL